MVVDSAWADRAARVCEAIGNRRMIKSQQPNNHIQPTAQRVRRG